MKHIKGILLISCLMLSIFAFAQNDLGSEEDLKAKATELFQDGKLVEASPLYAQLLALYPKDPEYNFKYGACLISSNADKSEALKYLQFATSKSNVDPLAYYYLGRVHHLNYSFAKAVKAYSKFKTKASTTDREKYQVDRNIEMCKNGNDLLSRINEVQVLDKQEIREKDFFRIYDLEGIDGQIIKKPEEFQSKEDKKRGENSLIYLPKDAKEVYYSSYGKKGENERDLFKAIKLGDGSWSEPVALGASINTPYDENFAFIHPDGRTLYFASKGHNSMGGYDLFVSTFDDQIKDWSAPVNLDFAFSSVDDDVLFICDESKSLAFFASNRSNADGKYTVYKVQVKKEPANLSIIQGKFIAQNSSNTQKAKITVINKANNQTIGVYETDENGEYQIEIPENGGQYQFNLETDENSPLHTGVVNIPKQDEFAVLGQELSLVGEGEQETLVIKNIFDGTVQPRAANGPQVSSDLLRKKANLEVNLDANEILAIESNKKEGSVKPASTETPANPNNTSETQLKDQLSSLIETTDLDLIETNKSIAAAYANALRNKNLADEGFDKASKSSLSDEDRRIADSLAKENAMAAAIATQQANKLEQHKVELDNRKQKLTEASNAIDGGDLANADMILSSLKANQISSASDLLANSISLANEEQGIAEQKESNAIDKMDSFNAERENLINKEQSLQNDVNAATGPEKVSLQKQLEDVQLDKQDIDFQIATSKTQLNQAKEEKMLAALKVNTIESVNETIANREDNQVSSISSEDKANLIDAIKTYQTNNQLAYAGGDNNSSEIPVLDNTVSKSQNSASNEEELNLAAIEANYSNQISAAKSKNNFSLQEQLYAEWDANLQEEVNKQNDALALAENSTESAAIEENLQSIKNERTKISSALQALQNEKLSASNQATKDALASYDPAADPGEVDVSTVDENSIIPEDYTSFDFKQEYNYFDEDLSSGIQEAKQALAKAAAYGKMAQDARTAAYNLPTAEERNRAFERANQFEEASKKQQNIAADKYSVVNKERYQRSQIRLENALAFEDEFDSDNFDLAVLLNNEANLYFEKAAEIRAGIDPNERLSRKEVDLQKAYDLEMLAIEKQQQALVSLQLAEEEDNQISSNQVEVGKLKIIDQTATQNAVASNTPENILAIKKADSIMAIVNTKNAQIEDINQQIQDAAEDAKPALIEQRNALVDERDQMILQANSYYQLASKLDENSLARATRPAYLIKPSSPVNTNLFIDLDTVTISENRKQIILSSKAYTDYAAALEKRNRALKSAETQYQIANEKDQERIRLVKQAQVLMQQAANASDETEKQRLINEATIIELRSQQLLVEIDSINKIIKVENYILGNTENEMLSALNNLSPEERAEIQQLAIEQLEIDAEDLAINSSSSGEGEETSLESSLNNPNLNTLPNQENRTSNEELPDYSNEPLASNLNNQNESSSNVSNEEERLNTLPSRGINENANLAIPRQLKQAIFVTLANNESAYTDDKPIPVNPEMPEGLVYKVQVGAFRNPIPQDLFKGFAPLMAETTSSGITRYTAGLFLDERSAVVVRDQIRQIGYPDAFVVAFLNGERISISQARQSDNSAEGYVSSDPVANNSASDSQGLTQLPASFSASDIEPVDNIVEDQGLFFTVQIGVYSKPVKAGTFNQYNDLYVKVLNNGMIRYNSGKFKDATSANQLKEQISNSISDAFVVAYYQGRRISLAEATRLLNQ